MHYLDQSLLQPHVFGATQYELRLFLEFSSGKVEVAGWTLLC
jgi:hypothetical protein